MDQVAGQERSGEEGRKGLSHIPFDPKRIDNFAGFYDHCALYAGEDVYNWLHVEDMPHKDKRVYISTHWDRNQYPDGNWHVGMKCKVIINWGNYDYETKKNWIEFHPKTMQDFVDIWPEELPPLHYQPYD